MIDILYRQKKISETLPSSFRDTNVYVLLTSTGKDVDK